MDLQTTSGASPLFIASQYGHVEVVEALLIARSHVDLQSGDEDGASPLFMALREGHTEVEITLLATRANVNEEHIGQSLLSFPLSVVKQVSLMCC